MKRLLLVVGIVGSLLVSWLMFRVATTSAVTVIIEPTVSPLTTTVTVDGKVIAPSGNGGTQYTASINRGNHMIRVSSAGFKETEDTFSTDFRENKDVQIKLEQIAPDTIEDAARAAVGSIEDVEVFDPKFFGINDWIVFFSRSSNGESEGSVVVARFNTDENSWKIIDEGTDINTLSPLYSTAPRELVDYIEGLYQ